MNRTPVGLYYYFSELIFITPDLITSFKFDLMKLWSLTWFNLCVLGPYLSKSWLWFSLLTALLKSLSLQTSCKVSQFIHLYLFGCNYFWMLCEGIYLHTLIVVAVFAQKQHLIWYYLLGWGELLQHSSVKKNTQSHVLSIIFNNFFFINKNSVIRFLCFRFSVVTNFHTCHSQKLLLWWQVSIHCLNNLKCIYTRSPSCVSDRLKTATLKLKLRALI